MADTPANPPAAAPPAPQAVDTIEHDAERATHKGIHELIDYLLAEAKKAGIAAEKVLDMIKAKL